MAGNVLEFGGPNYVSIISNLALATNETVQLDNLKIRVVSNGNGFELGAVSTSFNYDIAGWCTYNLNTSNIYGTTRSTQPASTTFSHPLGWAATNAKGNDVWLMIRDTTNSKLYRVMIMHGGTAAGATHAVIIERLA